jgi:hypothetical protein
VTFWDFVYKVWPAIESRITRILALVAGSVAIIAAAGVIPLKQLPYWMLALALLNYWRGQSTATTYKNAQALLASVTPPAQSLDAAATMLKDTVTPDPLALPVKPAKPLKTSKP